MASKSSSNNSNSNTLLVIIVDVSPSAWGDRDIKRTQRDEQRVQVQNKRSIGPAILDELIQSICAYIVAMTSMERHAAVIIIGVAHQESAVIFPRKDVLNTWLHSTHGYTPNIRTLQHDFVMGIAELVQRATMKVTTNNTPNNTHIVHDEAAMAAAFSKALCIINRLLVAAPNGYGVSALLSSTTRSQFRVDASSSSDDDHPSPHGVIAMMNPPLKKGNFQTSSKLSSSSYTTTTTTASTWEPRIWILQVSPDRSYDYNAFMNCAFAAAKHHIVVDGCYLSSELTSNTQSSSSSFLEQTCDITGGIYLAPSGAAQVGGALTAVLFAVFLPPLSCRYQLNLPTLHKVDYRARCFDTGETVDMAYVCNQCLSIFHNRPTTYECSTCHAPIIGNEKYRPIPTNNNNNSNIDGTTE
jgi:transcription initiation factor TFIIH subunit 3